MKKIAIIDNYDSFTYNLVHYFEDLDGEVTVFRNDEFELEELIPFDKIVLSPGPGIPENAGLLKKVIETFSPTKSILGVCLGQQAIGEVFGANLVNLEQVYHGVSTQIQITVADEPLFNGLGDQLEVGRYHSWVIDPMNFPETLEITSVGKNGEIMSLRHRTFDVKGVQFHPESVLTPQGKTILSNWLKNQGQ
ncbi:aminodeoxychorismate/anthranilate synthase component II [Flavobacterium sp. CYK-4]|uniref:anthranilate synthase component II n=1 Tax=Flavobacterium lotistagni TaxID=2709660 RepID=UPI00140B61A4|nr:aminodeoxychorismate/anthranilate synthase component II [Flavobacterium lotistagni]NHM07366.1 aminodeoxychorismate/anthranilate synthase component II [Flavobacterium lotistagni]